MNDSTRSNNLSLKRFKFISNLVTLSLHANQDTIIEWKQVE